MSDLVGDLARDPAREQDSVLEPLLPTPWAPKVAWYWRVYETASTYLPLLLMTLLALGTWWLASNAPGLLDPVIESAAKHEPDYVMRDFTVQRFTPDGPLKAQIEGQTLRHYPDTDTLEIDEVRIRAISPDGAVTNSSARRAVSNSDGSEVQLLGGARVVREASANEEAIEFRGEFLHAFLNTEQVKSHLPVTLIRGATEIRGDSLDYDNLERVVTLKGRVRATFATPQSAEGRKR
ncbi:LPS export ABC transporter periplasmic protein LptC [soil metagenome]